MQSYSRYAELAIPLRILRSSIRIGVVLAICFLLPQMVVAQSPTWTAAEVMGETWFPDITTDSTGAAHLVWAGGDSAYDLVMYSSNAGGQGWSIPNDIQAMEAPEGRFATRPAMLIDPNGVLHLTYRGDTIWYSNVPLLQANDAQAWSKPQAVAVAGYFSRLVYGHDQTLHLFFTENKVRTDCTNCFHLMYQQSKDGGNTWSSSVDITPTLNGVAKPQIILDARNIMYVVFEAGYGGDLGQLSDPATVMYMASYDGGTNWTVPVRFAPERGDTVNAQARNIAIGIDGYQQLIAVWWAIPDDIIYYQTSSDQGRTWSRPNAIPGIAGIWSIFQSRLDNYTLATDSAGHVHLVFAGRRTSVEEKVSLMHLEWGGSSWSSLDTIATYDGDVPEWPRIAIGNGNQLHVTWFVRDEANLFNPDTTNYRVWYARGQSAAPYVAPVAVPIPTPVPSTVLETALQETLPLTLSTHLLDERLKQPAEQEVTLGSLMTENDDIMLLTMSLLPVTLLLGVITFLNYWRKHT